MRAMVAAVLIGLLSCAGPGSQVPREKPASFAAPESRRLVNLERDIEGNTAINTPAQCVRACQLSKYASGICK